MSDYLLSSAFTGVSDAAQWKVVMPARANSPESAFIAGMLAAVALLSLNTTASSATECPESSHLRIGEPGHWYYRSDRTGQRPCWFFVPAQVTADTPVSVPLAETVGGDSRQPWLSFFMPSFLQPPSSLPQQMEVPQTQPSTIPDRSGKKIRSILSKLAKRNKTVRQERQQIVPPPITTGAADRRDQPKQSASNEKQGSPLNGADRESLFQDFVKWQLDRNLFGRP